MGCLCCACGLCATDGGAAPGWCEVGMYRRRRIGQQKIEKMRIRCISRALTLCRPPAAAAEGGNLLQVRGVCSTHAQILDTCTSSSPMQWGQPGPCHDSSWHAYSTAAASAADSMPTPTADKGMQPDASSSCWSCHHRFKKGGVVCTGCEKIQPLDTSLNYFELLGM